jgi:CheY-like chemotaxis protein
LIQKKINKQSFETLLNGKLYGRIAKMKKILIADDLPEVRKLVEMTLKAEDFQIFHAESGEQAVETAKREKPDLIIMDIMMPGEMDGLSATRLLKNDPDTKDCYVLMLTAKGQEADKESGFESGADGYFAKPFSPLDLLKKVEEIIG